MKSVLFLWRQLASAPLAACDEVSELRHDALQAFTRCVCRRQSEGLLVSEDLLQWLETDLLPAADEQATQQFLAWAADYSKQQLAASAALQTQRSRLLTAVRNLIVLTAVSTRHPLTSSPACVAVTDELLRLHAYLQSLLETLQTARLALAPSPACAAKSSEEVAILLLDDMRCVDILNEEIALRLVPFCARRNMSVDEVLSYYVQRELETVGELDDRRVRVLWDHIRSHELRVEALKGVESRLPPYSAALMAMVEECVGYVGAGERADG